MEPEPEPARCPVASPACWICLDSEPDESGARPQPTGCACRGGATTHAHVGCLARAAKEKGTNGVTAMWWQCPTCKQQWTGPLALALARRRYELVAARPEADGERMQAAHALIGALRVAGRYEEALPLGRATLELASRVWGPEHPGTLDTMQSVATVCAASGDLAAAMPLMTQLVAMRRRVDGHEHSSTLLATQNLANAHQQLRQYHRGLELQLEAVAAWRRRTEGDGATRDEVATLQAIAGLAHSFLILHEFARSLPLQKEATDGMRRVLGPQHPDTLLATGQHGTVYHNMGDHASAQPFLQEAVDGLTKISSGGNQTLKDAKATLAHNTRCLADPRVAAKFQNDMKRERRVQVESRLPAVAATVVGVQSRPELNGTQVTIRRFLIDKGRYTVELPPDGDGKQEQISLKPTSLELAEGAIVVATGLTGARELNGRRGKAQGWDAEAGRYTVRLEGEQRPKRLKPENCRADVLAL